MTDYFVTGTDTGVGKTFVTACLARRARRLDPAARVFAFKPVETGCTAEFGEDQELLAQAAGNWQRGSLRGLYQFRLPAAPLVAANAESRSIDIDAIARTLDEGRLAARNTEPSGTRVLTLVEGAGGWRVPLTASVDMGALAKQLGLAVVVVARASLGTINHSLLTLEAVERDGCTIAALVLSKLPDEDLQFVASNASEISRRWPGPVLVLDSSSALDPLLA